MQFKLKTFAEADEISRRNWTVCWKWALCILAAELIFLLLVFGSTRANVAQVTPEATQTERVQPQRSKAGSGACRFIPSLAARDI